jgi:hypothetical protein
MICEEQHDERHDRAETDAAERQGNARLPNRGGNTNNRSRLRSRRH